MQLAREGSASRGARVLSCIPEYVRLLRTQSTPSLSPCLPDTLPYVVTTDVFLLSLLVPGEELAPRRTRGVFVVLSSPSREGRGARASIPPRVIARYEFHVALARKTTFARRAGKRGRGRRRITGRGEKVGGSPNSLLQPRGRQSSPARSPLIKKRHLRARQSRAKSDARSYGRPVIRKRFMGRRGFAAARDVRRATEKGEAEDTTTLDGCAKKRAIARSSLDSQPCDLIRGDVLSYTDVEF